MLKGLRREVSACKSMLKWQPLPKRQWNFSPLTHQEISCCACFVSHAAKEQNMGIKGKHFCGEKKGKKGETLALVHVDGISRTDKCMLLLGVKRHILSCFTHLIHLENTGTARYDMNYHSRMWVNLNIKSKNIYNIIQQ